MIYTIAFGENELVCVSLDSKGTKYTASVWNRIEHRMDFFEEFDSLAWACKKFFELCRENNVERHKIERNASDFSNID